MTKQRSSDNRNDQDNTENKDIKDDKAENMVVAKPLDDTEVTILKTYGSCGPYNQLVLQREEEIQTLVQRVKDQLPYSYDSSWNDSQGLLPTSQWDWAGDQRMLVEEGPLQVARCSKIIDETETRNGNDSSSSSLFNNASLDPDTMFYRPVKTDHRIDNRQRKRKYVVSMGHAGNYVVALGERLAPTDVEQGMRVGLNRTNFAIEMPLPTKVDATVSLMTVEEKPDVTYNDIGGVADAKEALREVLELPLLHPERFERLGIDPPRGVLLYGPPGTGKTLAARAIANRTNATFIRVIGSELVQKYIGEGARLVREIFKIARSKSPNACIVFFDEIDAIGGTRVSEEEWSDNEVQRTMLQIASELDGFDARGNIKVLMATNRPDILDPALVRPGRIDRKIEFGIPDLHGREQILKIHCKRMNVDRDIRYELIARLCHSATGADLRSVCTEAGMFAIRHRRKSVSEQDFLDSVTKVIKGYKKFSSTPKYMVYN